MTAKWTPRRPSIAPRLHAGARVAVVAVVWLAATALAPRAQENEASPPDAAAGSTRAETPAIPTNEIPQRASEDEARLQAIRFSLRMRNLRVEEIEAGLQAQAEAIGRLEQAPGYQNLDQLGVMELSRLRTQWESRRSPLADWQGMLQRRSRALLEQARTLREMRATWVRARQEASMTLAPGALIERIDSLLRTCGEIEASIQDRLSALLTLQGHVSSEQARVGEALERCAIAVGQAGWRLLTLDSDPLWTALRRPRATGSLTGQILLAWRQRTDDISSFLAENAMRVRLHVGIFIALFLAVLTLGRRGQRRILQAAPIDPAAGLLRRPMAASLVLALVASRWIYPAPTTAVSEFLLLALVVPILRLLPPLLLPRMRLSLLGLASLFVVDRLRGLGAGQPLLHRLLLIAVGAMGVALLVWTALPRRQTAEDGRGWARLPAGLARAAALLLGTALLANLTGAVALASMLTTATLMSAYAAVVLFAAALVLDAMLGMSLGTRTPGPAHPALQHAENLERWGRTAIHLVASFIWLRVTLIFFGIYHPLVQGATTVLFKRWRFGEFDLSIGDVLRFAVVLGIGFALSRIIPLVLEGRLMVRSSVPLGLRATISTLLRFCLMTLGFLAALAAAGVDLSQVALITGALGVGIGFGLQNLVSNFLSGVILAFERPVEVGDRVQVGDLTGRMKQVGLRASIIGTADGADVIVPNADLISSRVINWSLTNNIRRIEMPVSVAYGTDPHRVLEILARVASGRAGVLRSPAPSVQFRGFGESSLDFALLFWVHSSDDSSELSSDVGLAVHDALKQAGVEVPFPQRDLHLRSIAPEAGRALGGNPPEPAPGGPRIGTEGGR